MKKIKNNIVLIVILMLLTSYAFASNTSGEEDLVAFANPEGPVGIGYLLLRKKTAIVN